MHALEVIGRLASYEALNVTPKSKVTPDVIRHQIDLVDCYQRPQVLYFNLPSSVASIGAPSVARLILYYLLIAGKSTARRVKVHVVIDEFQRMATESLDHMLQLARSLDVSLILANQSLNDLKVGSSKIYSAVATNCAVRQWFSVNSVEDIAILEKLMGTRERVEVSEMHGKDGVSYTYRTQQVPRASVTDLHTVSEDPRLSILQISGTGRGYARYSGIPFVCQSDYHITKKEYEKRKQFPWPMTLPGMMLSKESLDWRQGPDSSPKSPSGPKAKPATDSDDEPNTWNSNLFE